MKGNLKIAVLMTCHNRREKTLNCINALFNAKLPQSCTIEVFLVDDGSTDGTDDAVKQQYPVVNVIRGNGNLFWNRGMHLAWEFAVQKSEYDYYLWLNDDTIMEKNALTELLDCYKESKNLKKKETLIVGACKNDANSEIFSYGGRNNNGPVLPNGKIQKCNLINGNIVLVPKKIFNEIGNLSPKYTHAIGDNDYGLRALNAGFGCFTTKKYVAVCPTNGLEVWCNPKIPLFERFKNLYSPKGLNIKEYIIFLKEHKRKYWVVSTIKVYLKTLFPEIYMFLTEKLSTRKQ